MSRLEQIRGLLRTANVDRAAVAEVFEAAAPRERVEITEALDGGEQAKLWHAAEGGAVSIAEMVPRDVGALKPVIFHGKNSLAAFTRFQKRFCRPENGDGSRLFVTNGLSDDLTVIDTASAKALKTITVGRVPHSVVVDD
jgi:YVTN family beta-propeller protein